jgi:hypothetical protein
MEEHLLHSLRHHPFRPSHMHRVHRSLRFPPAETFILLLLFTSQDQIRLDAINQQQALLFGKAGCGDPPQAGALVLRPAQGARDHQRGQSPGERLLALQVLLRRAAREVEGQIAEAGQTRPGQLAVRLHRLHAAGFPASQIQEDREERSAIPCLDAACVLAEPAEHPRAGPGLYFHVDQHGFPFPQGEPSEEIYLPAILFEELLVQEHRNFTAKAGGEIWHHQPEEVREECAQ